MLILLSSFLAGVVFVILVELFIVYRWFSSLPTSEPKLVPIQKPVINPKDIIEYCSIEGATASESCHFLNLVFQFLWKEWRDSPKTRNFFMRKMNLEFQEMMLNKAAGRFMEQITVSDYYLGDSLPVIKKATVMKIDSRNPKQVPREIDIALEIDYCGGFIISLDVGLIFGKSAHFTVKLNSLSGRLRLQFTRNPCTHWSFSFYEDPVMDIQVESNFQGKNLPKLTSLIHNQIRRSIKKKHTFPHYKVRYKPFFVQDKPQDGKNEVFVHNCLATVGKLEVEIVECTRLVQLPKGSYIYCTVSLSQFPWKEDMSMRRSLWPIHEVLISRPPSRSIGISFHVEDHVVEDDKHEVIRIKQVNPSLASKVDIQQDDILLSINNVDITSMKQAVRLVNNAGDKFTFKLQRPPKPEDVLETTNRKEVLTNVASTDKVLDEKSSAMNDSVEESFDYNSILISDEDNETEQFVNIIITEIEKEFADDDEKQQIIKKIRRESGLKLRDSPLFGKRQKHFVAAVDLQNSAVEEGPEEISEHSSLERSSSTASKEPSDIKSSIAPDESIADSGIFSGIPERKQIEVVKNKRSFSFSFRKKSKTDQPTKSSSESALNQSLTSSSKHSSSASLKDVSDKSQELKVKAKKRVTLQENFVGKDDGEDSCDDLLLDEGLDFPRQKTTQNADAEWDNISHHQIETVSDQNGDDDEEVSEQRTTLASSLQEPVWNETFSFDVEKEHRFLNICVKGKNVVTYEKDILLGYVSIPLMELAIECLSTSSAKSIQKFLLASQSNRQPVNRTHLRTVRPGMKMDCCNGDITLAYRYKPSTPEHALQDEDRIKSKPGKETKVQATGKRTSDAPEQHEDVNQTHNFVGTEFYFPTRCDYCQNKVWRKVAFQCSLCAMTCHKRCIDNAQVNTYCTSSGVRAKPPVWQMNYSAEALTHLKEDSSTKSQESNFTRTHPPKVPNEYALRPGIRNGRVSPNMLRRRVKHSRRSNLDDNIRKDGSIDAIPEDVEDCGVNDSLTAAAVTAREAGRELFASLDGDNRETDIQKKVESLQEEVDVENDKQNEVRTRLRATQNPELVQKLQFTLRKSEERGQALALLMIQYCAALNECLLLEEPRECDL